jgi:acylphosphatase
MRVPKTPDTKNTEEKPAAIFALVRGKVQGVGFRYSTVKEAGRLKLKGWVRNVSGGNVEVWAEGQEENLALFHAWLRKGPKSSRVVSVQKDDREPKGYSEFTVEY